MLHQIQEAYLIRPASVHVQPTDFHGRDSQGKQEKLHEKARMETFRIIFNVCVLKTFHMECKFEACCPYFIIATFHLPPQNYISFLFCPSQSLAYFPPSLKSVASHRHSLTTRLKPMVMDLWRLARLAIFHFSSIFCLHLRLQVACSTPAPLLIFPKYALLA